MIIKMNFGDILNKWEHISAQDNFLKKEQINDKLRLNTDIKKTHSQGENRRRLLKISPDVILDIHGLTSEEAWNSLDHFFSDAKDMGYEKLRIIHGKGNRSQGDAVLKNTVRKYIEKCPFTGESGYEKAKYGGSGATWVLLK